MPVGFGHPDLSNVWKTQAGISSLKLWIEGREGNVWKRLSGKGLEQNHTQILVKSQTLVLLQVQRTEIGARNH